MSKIKPEDLDGIAEKIKKTMLLREGECRIKVIVHMGTCGIAAGARDVMKALTEELDKSGVKDVLPTQQDLLFAGQGPVDFPVADADLIGA